MKFFYDHEKSDIYNSVTRRTKNIDHDEFIHKFLSDVRIYGVTNTQIKPPTTFLTKVLSPATHVLVLDCDSDGELLAAKHWVKTELKAETVVIESSPGHYWVVVDIIDEFRNIIYMMAEIPGVDSQFVDFCRRRKNIYIRIVPKSYGCNAYRPRFPETHDLTNEGVIKWYEELKSWFCSEDFDKMFKAGRLRLAIENGDMHKFAADPAFAI
jgi:hypothetical protein